MKSFSKFMMIVLFAALAGGAVLLAMWDIPAPNQKIEKVLPDDRFPQ